MKPAYLIAGDDGAKVDAAVGRLRGRAEREGGTGALEVFEGAGTAAPDVDELIGALPAMSLIGSRRYLLADGVERWRATQIGRLAEALATIPEETTVVLVARGAAPKGLGEAVEKAGGEVLSYAAPRKRELPAWVVEAARKRGLNLHPSAARILVSARRREHRAPEQRARPHRDLGRARRHARRRGGRGADRRHLRARRLDARRRDRQPRRRRVRRGR